jgi:hypothetical protein
MPVSRMSFIDDAGSFDSDAPTRAPNAGALVVWRVLAQDDIG